MGKDVIIACDFSSMSETLTFLDKFEKKPFVKIGMELFYSEGPLIIKKLKERGHKIFLDLKLHDIPNTVKKSMKVLGAYGVDIVNVHASGTVNMMKEAKAGLTEGAKDFNVKPILIAVTQLTSTDEETMKKDLMIDKSLDEVVSHYAKNAVLAGLDGVVCSAYEAKKVHELCGKNFITVTPGIRLVGDEVGDQKRVMTPKKAKEEGADYIVVGRSITSSDNPVEMYNKCCEEFVEN